MVRVPLQSLLKDLDRLVEFSSSFVERAQVVVGEDQGGVVLNGIPVGGYRFPLFACALLYVTQVVVNIGPLGIQLQGALGVLDRLFQFSGLPIDHGEVVVRLHVLRIALYRRFEGAYGGGIAPLIREDGSTKKERTGGTGIPLENVTGKVLRDVVVFDPIGVASSFE